MKLLAMFLLLTMPMRIYKDTTLAPNGEYHQPIIIMADNVTLDCRNSVFIGDTIGVGILLQKRSNVTIRNCRVRNFDVGLYAVSGKNLVFEKNDFSGNYLDDNSNIEHLKPIPHGGMILNGIQGARIVGNTSNGNVTGIQIINSIKTRVQQNTTSRNRGWGIYLYGTTASQIYSNTVEYNNRSCPEWGKDAGCGAAGIVLTKQSDHNQIAWNSLNYNGDGIYQGNLPETASNDLEIFGNYISHSVANGIEATYSFRNYIHHNQMIEDNYGGWFGYSQQLRFEYNVIKDSKREETDPNNPEKTFRVGVQSDNAQGHRYLGNTFDGAGLFLKPHQGGKCQDNSFEKNEFKGDATAKTPDCK